MSTPDRIFQFKPGPRGFIVRRQLGQLYGYLETDYFIMANDEQDADRRLNVLGKTISITPAVEKAGQAKHRTG